MRVGLLAASLGVHTHGAQRLYDHDAFLVNGACGAPRSQANISDSPFILRKCVSKMGVGACVRWFPLLYYTVKWGLAMRLVRDANAELRKNSRGGLPLTTGFASRRALSSGKARHTNIPHQSLALADIGE